MVSIKDRPIKTILVFVFLIFTFPFFFLGGPNEYSTPLLRAVWDCGHLSFFFAFTLAVDHFHQLNRFKHFLLLSLSVFILGGSIELIQLQIGRDGNWLDVLRDLTGAWCAFFLLQPSSRIIILCRTLAIALALPNLLLIVLAGYSQVIYSHQFPVLASFESPIEIRSMKNNATRQTQFVTDGNYGLTVPLTRAAYSGFTLHHFFNSWMGYHSLVLDIFNPVANTLKVTLRVNDVEHLKSNDDYADRFNQPLLLVSGWNHIVIALDKIQTAPQGRLMDFNHIESMQLFAMKLAVEQVIYVDNIHLE